MNKQVRIKVNGEFVFGEVLDSKTLPDFRMIQNDSVLFVVHRTQIQELQEDIPGKPRLKFE